MKLKFNLQELKNKVLHNVSEDMVVQGELS